MDHLQQKYLRRAKIIAAVLSFTPFIRMIGLNGSVARGEATEESDIDFWICLKSGRLWSGRAFVTVLTHLTGYHRYQNKIAGRICLNTYQTEESLEIHPKNEKNAKDYANIKILYAAGSIANHFFISNRWIEQKGYRFTHKKAISSSIFPAIIRGIFEIIYDILFGDSGERYSRSFQIKRILADPRTQNARVGQIYISDAELRFHPKKV